MKLPPLLGLMALLQPEFMGQECDNCKIMSMVAATDEEWECPECGEVNINYLSVLSTADGEDAND